MQLPSESTGSVKIAGKDGRSAGLKSRLSIEPQNFDCPVVLRGPGRRAAGCSQDARRANTSFLHGADWAYAAGVMATVIGIVMVIFLFPNRDDELQLLREYQEADSRQVKAGRAAAAPAG